MKKSIFLAFSSILSISLILNYSFNTLEKIIGDNKLELKNVTLICVNMGDLF